MVEIENYKEIFNRSRQPWRVQKESPKLILAVKKDGFLYEGSYVAPDFGYSNFYYNSLILNCLYDCEYCYLQGMYPSANTVIFVNLEDFFQHTDRLLEEKSPLYLCISYDTDLLAFESLVPYAGEWIRYAESRPDLIIELRTKSAAFRHIRELQPLPNVVLAWTLSPQEIIDLHEAKTPSLKARVTSAGEAVQAGWNVRLCFDPLLYVKNWPEIYSRFISNLSNVIEFSRIKDFSLGVFRMNAGYLQLIRQQRSDSSLVQFPFKKTVKTATYPSTIASELVDHMRGLLLEHAVDSEKIIVT